MEKQFWGLELQHVPRGTNQEADDIQAAASGAWRLRGATLQTLGNAIIIKHSAT